MSNGGAGKKLWGYYPTTDVWVPLQVDANGKVIVDMSAIMLGDLGDVSVAAPADDDILYWNDAASEWQAQAIWVAAHAASHENGGADEISVEDLSGELADGQKVKTDYIDKTHLSQDFGASSARLQNLLITPIAGDIIRFGNAGAGNFTAKINGNPTATSVTYDGEANENFWRGIASGASQWGRVILRNTTRGNSRKVVTVNRTTNVITTESSTDDWANNDNLTTYSSVVGYSQYFDIDVSAEVPATTSALIVRMNTRDQSGAATSRSLRVHPYQSYSSGYSNEAAINLANEQSIGLALVPMVSQKIACLFAGFADVFALLTVAGYVEPADT